MLKDSRVKVNEPANNGYTPLWYVANEMLKDRLWEGDVSREARDGKMDVIGVAKENDRTEVVTLLERFKIQRKPDMR